MLAEQASRLVAQFAGLGNVTSGYEPKISLFSLPAKRYLNRHDMKPLTVTKRCRPAESASL